MKNKIPKEKKKIPTNTPSKNKSIGKANKRKGCNAERYYAEKFRELGFTHCKTARYGSRLHDDSKIDLINLPINCQIKAGIQRNLKPHEVLQDMVNTIAINFPAASPENNNINIMIHKRQIPKGRKKNDFDEIVSITFADFTKLLKAYTNDLQK